jgi:coronin-1B/1C/6
MSVKVVRNSKFRHVYGQALKKQDCYDNIRITKSSWDATFCAVNPKFIAIITEAAGGGSFLVMNIEKTGRVDREAPLVVGHKAAVLDIAFCPHNDNLIASASEDCTIKVWELPNGGLGKNLTDCVADLVAHQRRVGVISWHPSAHLVLLSAGSDNKVFVWNVATAEILTEIDAHTDMIYSAVWNYSGSKILTTCKDKMIRIFDPRTGNKLKEAKGHQAVKPMRGTYMKDGRIFTTGFSRTGERQYGLWDEDKLDSPLVMEELDNSNGLLFPFYDEDTNVIYLCGKGDSAIRYFEYTPEAPYIHYLNTYSSGAPQRGMGWMSKRGLNVTNCEISRFFKLHNSGLCEVITMTVPRKSELFQEDLYPDTAAQEAAISAEDWFAGRDADPVLCNMREVFNAMQGDKDPGRGASVMRNPSHRFKPSEANGKPTNGETNGNGVSHTPAPAASSSSLSRLTTSIKPAHDPSPQTTQQSNNNLTFGPEADLFQKVQEEIKRLKIIVKGHEKRIKTLEDKLTEFNINYDDDDE